MVQTKACISTQATARQLVACQHPCAYAKKKSLVCRNYLILKINSQSLPDNSYFAKNKSKCKIQYMQHHRKEQAF